MRNQNLQQPVVGGRPVHRNIFSSHLMQTLILLTAMVLGGVNAWGQTVLGSYSFATNNPTPTADGSNAGDDKYTLLDETNIKIYAQGLKTGDSNREFVYQEYNGLYHMKLQNESKSLANFKIVFTKGYIKAGDVLKISCGRAYTLGSSTMGYKVDNGSTGTEVTASGNKSHGDGAIVLSHQLSASEIQEDGDNEYILIYRLNSDFGYGSITIEQGCTVSFSANNASMGTVTAKRLDTNEDITSGTRVPYNTRVELTAHPNDGYVFTSWSNSEKVLTRIWTVTVDGHPSANFEAEGDGYIVTFSGLYGGGNVTAKRNDTNTEITSGKKVPSGTSVTFTATPSGENLNWKWTIDGADTYSQDPQTITIEKNITVNHQFGSVYVNVYTNDANLGTVNIAHGSQNATTFHVTPWAGKFTLTATPTASGTFMGWYSEAEHSNKISDQEVININNPAGTNNYFALFEASTGHPTPTCVNNTIDLSKITVVSGATYNPSTHAGSITANYGTISIRFREAVDLHELNSLTLAGTNVEKTGDAGAFNGVSFKYDGGGEFITYNYPFSVSNPTDDQKESLKRVTEITLFGDDNNHKGDFTLTSITLNFGGTHTKKSKPVLNNGTTAEMVVSAGTRFTISASNGYWREYKSDLSGEKPDGCISGVWASTHTFETGLAEGNYYFGIQDNDNKTCDFGVNHHSDLTTIHVTVTEAFNPAIDLNSSDKGSGVESFTNGVLTVNKGSDNGVKVKDLTGHGSEYTGIRLTTQGDACRIIVRWGEDNATQKATIIDASEKATTSFYSWSMLGVPENQVANLTSIRFFGAAASYSESNKGVTTFSNASLVNETETSPYTREIGELREFNLNDTRVELYHHGDHYQMGGNIQWVYKSETNGDKFAMMKTTQTSYNQMEIFNSGHSIPTYEGVRIDYKGKHFRVIAYKGEDKYIYTVPASEDARTVRYIAWSELKKDGNGAVMADANDVTRIEVAGCSEHTSEETVNFYGIRLQKELAGVVYTDESVTEGHFNGVQTLTYTETIDGKNMSVAFYGIRSQDDRAGDCNGVIIRQADNEDNFTIHAPAGHKIAKVRVGLGENTTGTARFNDVQNVTVNNQDQIEWANTTATKSVTMGFPSETENATFHIKYVYYELAEEDITAIEVNGKTRQYDVYKPTDISGTVGVVLSLHGASKDYYDDSGRINFNAIADAKKDVNDKKFIVVYPRGIMRELRGQERGWESYTEDNTEDVEFFKAIVKDINDKDNGLTVDMSRIYLAGYANGGMMAYKAAHQAGDFFAAFASVGGFPVNESHLFHAGAQPTPFMHIQGAADEIFNAESFNYRTISQNMTYRNGAHFNPYDAGHNSDGGVIADNVKVTREIHVADEGGAAYFLYTITGMTHVPSYDWTGDDVDDVAQSIWKFFDYSGKVNNIDKTLKFRINDPDELWTIATTGCSTADVEVGYVGLDNVNTGTSVLSYGGRTKTGEGTGTYNKDTNNNNIWHSLQFEGGINGAAHFLKLNVETDDVHGSENTNDFFLVKLTKTGATTPVFAKRYQAGRGKKDLYINFAALPGFNEYKLEITKSSPDLEVKVHGIEAYSGRCEDKSQEENPTAFYDVAAVLTGMQPIYQPIFGKSFDGIAKEYLPIAEIPVGELATDSSYRPNDIPTKDNEDKDYKYRVISDDLTAGGAKVTSMPSTVIASTGWTENAGRYTATITGNKLFSLAQSGKTGEDTAIKSNNAFIFVPDGQTYTVDKVKGLNISQLGRAQMPEYLNGTRGVFPDHGMIAIKLQGTLDFYLLAQNEVTYTGTDPNPARRTLKVYYTNDQLDGELKELEEWWFFGTRSENGYSNTNGNSLGALSAGVRLPQLGKDGTCTVFITYEGREKGAGPFTHVDAEDNDKIWIKGFVIKRPDLKVTIGRTDSNYTGQEYKGENNTKCTRFGENKPYVWSFENVGFNNTRNKADHRDINDKKVNEKDGRTYVCGGTDDSVDHLLLYSDGASANNNDKVQFDGRKLGNEHIEFLKESVYDMKNKPVTDRKLYDPIKSNGLKVNVTGSGWFKIKCTAPNGPVNMKVYTQPNYGSSYISLLREFRVEKSTKETEAEREIDWKEYTVYLKSRGIHDGNNGFWDGATSDEGKEEIMRQSLFVVFDNIGEASSYDEGHPQLNIHELSWLNEEPADYVFQREEDPKLLTTWQEIRRNGETVLWWKAGNDDDAEYPMLKENNNNTYNRLGQTTTNITGSKGVKSPGGYASTTVPSDAGTYDAYWDIAAPASTNAHTEKAYGGSPNYNSNTEYINNGANNTEFDTPVSGSFIRICAMQNTYVVAHVLPGAANGAVYVLDETGAQIPFANGNDDDKKRLGYVAALVNADTDKDGGKKTDDCTVRIDFCANAGKEYFICAKDASISLARLEVQDWRYKPEKSATTLTLTDNANNSTTITDAYSTKEFYRDATLARKLTKGNWVSLVLPFSMNEKKFKEVFGDNARCIHFSGMDFDGKIVKLTHHYYNMIVAGRPVFVRPDINIDKSNPLQISDVTLQANEVRFTVINTEKGNFTFTGSYDMQPIAQNDLFINNNQMTYLNVVSSSYPGMRSFIQNGSHYDFETNTTPGQGGAKAMFLEFYDVTEDIPTEVMEIIGSEFGKNVVVVTKSTKVYDLNGRVVAEGANISNLPAGIYIVNGKKYIVK